jgi:DNA-binding MarR family transcriptional regulator
MRSPPNIGELLRDPYMIIGDRLYGRIAEAGYPDIRPAHGSVFQYMGDEGSRVTELAERALVTKQTMGYLVDNLEERGYVERKPDPQDGRAKIVRLTDKGRELVRVVREIIAGIEAEWAKGLGEERMELLRGLLEDLNTVAKE